MTGRMGVVGLALAMLALPLTAAGQTAQVGQVSVEVRDLTGAVLPGVTVTLTSEDRGVSRVAVTDGAGKLVFAVVPLGKYSLSTKLSNFETKTLTGNLVEAAKTTSVAVTLNLARIEESAVVTGEVPIVDRTNQTVETRLRADEFQKMPMARSYLNLFSLSPGVVASSTSNLFSHGALASNNIFLFDGVNTTDTTTGTPGNSINFEAIQEVVVRTATISPEFGRGTGAIVDVITRTGTNQYAGTFKYLATNDAWNTQNSTKSQVAGADGTFASLARTRFNQLNPVWSETFGGPILANRLWFFHAYENARLTSPQRQTNAADGPGEDYQQRTTAPWKSFRVTAQLAPKHNVWVKYSEAPTSGFVFDYWGSAAERHALTSQNQGGAQWSGQYTGILGKQVAAEIMVSHADSNISATPFSTSAFSNGSPFLDFNDGRVYNGGAVVGYVKRPRTQVTGALSYFTTLMGNAHMIKVGGDWQRFSSQNSFKFPGGSFFLGSGYDPALPGGFQVPDSREDYDTAPSQSNGRNLAVYALDKFAMGARVSVQLGARIEHQSGTSDVGETTVSATTVAPRLSASFALTEDAKTLLVASYGRFHDGILQGFSDAFSAVPQQTNFDNYIWDGSSYVFDSRVEQGASAFHPNIAVTPRHLDEITLGVEQQVSRSLGASVRYIHRDWNNFIDDALSFNADGSINRVVTNMAGANRSYRGIEFTVDRRFSNDWSAAGSYTYSRTRGNHFGDDFTSLGNFLDANCRQTADVGLGDESGVFPCKDVQARLTGRPAYDRPHLIKVYGAYSHPFGPVRLTLGAVGNGASKITFTESRTVNVLVPDTLTSSGQTLTYYYEPLGSHRLSGMAFTTDLSIEASFHAHRQLQIGLKGEIFNLLNSETQTGVNNTSWCASADSASCQTAQTRFGTATARGSYLGPRTYRMTLLFRFDMK